MTIHTKQSKIIFVGPVCAGKTEAIAAVSDNKALLTDAIASKVTFSRKNFTTVAMDYASLNFQDNKKLHVYGIPGQERFRYMWDILSKGAIGFVILLDNTRPDPIKDLQFFINSFNELIKNSQFVVGVTKMDINPTPDIDEYIKTMSSLNLNSPVFEIDARCKEDILTLIMTLLYTIDPKLESL